MSTKQDCSFTLLFFKNQFWHCSERAENFHENFRIWVIQSTLKIVDLSKLSFTNAHGNIYWWTRALLMILLALLLILFRLSCHIFKLPVVWERHRNFLSVFAHGTRRPHEYQQKGRRNDCPASFGSKKYEIRSSSD